MGKNRKSFEAGLIGELISMAETLPGITIMGGGRQELEESLGTSICTWELIVRL